MHFVNQCGPGWTQTHFHVWTHEGVFNLFAEHMGWETGSEREVGYCFRFTPCDSVNKAGLDRGMPECSYNQGLSWTGLESGPYNHSLCPLTLPPRPQAECEALGQAASSWV